MFELEDYSSGFHDGFLSKYADSSGPTLDFCISDSLQDILDFDIRREIATVVGGSSEMSSLDHAIEAINNNNSNASTINTNSSPSRHAGSALSSSSSFMGSPWYGLPSSSSWSSSPDYFADVGACVDPNSVMPLISNGMIHQSPKVSLNANALRHRHPFSPPPPSPNEPNKSHLTFSPAQVKVSANALRNERLTSHIPKQIVAISSSVTAATTAPATMATNSALQRKQQHASVDAVKKDLAAEMRKVSAAAAASPQLSPMTVRDDSKGFAAPAANHTATTSNTIKLAPGIGGLTFANSITYNKLKQQSSLKSPQGSPITANGSIVLKRDRDSSPLHNMATLTANGKIIGRANNFTPKGIASAAHSPVMQSHSASSATLGGGQPATTVAPSLSSPSLHYAAGSPASVTAIRNTPTSARSSPTPMTPHLMKSQQLHRVKSSPSTSGFESEYPKPAYSYSCLIAIALKNSRSGSLPVSEIYSFMCDHFPYFKTAPSGWKNSVRHNLSLNRCFEKIEKPATNGNQRKGCLWAMKPERIAKMDEEVLKWSRKDPMAIRNAMVFPEHLEALERGEMKHGSSADSDVDADSQSEIEETSDLELEQELDDTIVENMFVEEDLGDEDIADEEVDDHELDDDEEHLLHGGDSMLAEDNIIVLNGAEHSHQGANSIDSECEGGQQGAQQVRLVQHQQVRPATFHQRKQQFQQQQQKQQQSRDFDIQVEDIYDAIDMEDDKDVVQRVINGGQQQPTPAHCLSSPSSSASSASDLIEMSSDGYQSPKRARLNINYSIGPAGELEKHVLQQQQLQQQINGQQLKPLQAQVIHRQAIKQVKLHTLQPLQAQNQQARHNHHIVVQTISAATSTNGINTLQATNSVVSTQSIPQFQQITAIAGTNNRRKVQLVNRIA